MLLCTDLALSYLWCHSNSPDGGGGGYSDIFYIYVGSGHFFGVQNSEFQYFWGFSEK